MFLVQLTLPIYLHGAVSQLTETTYSGSCPAGKVIGALGQEIMITAILSSQVHILESRGSRHNATSKFIWIDSFLHCKVPGLLRYFWHLWGSPSTWSPRALWESAYWRIILACQYIMYTQNWFCWLQMYLQKISLMDVITLRSHPLWALSLSFRVVVAYYKNVLKVFESVHPGSSETFLLSRARSPWTTMQDSKSS